MLNVCCHNKNTFLNLKVPNTQNWLTLSRLNILLNVCDLRLTVYQSLYVIGIGFLQQNALQTFVCFFVFLCHALDIYSPGLGCRRKPAHNKFFICYNRSVGFQLTCFLWTAAIFTANLCSPYPHESCGRPEKGIRWLINSLFQKMYRVLSTNRCICLLVKDVHFGQWHCAQASYIVT